MKLSPDTIRQRFRSCQVRMTPQRVAIYRALAATTAHPTADDLYRSVKRLHPMISRNTVYYTLGVLRRAGLVQEVNYWHDGARFDANVARHHHLICLACRKIEDVTHPALDELQDAGQATYGFRVVGHRVEFHGYCRDCWPTKRRADRQRS